MVVSRVGDVTRFMSILKSKYLITLFNWNEQIENSTKVNTYKLISEFQFQRYLDIIKKYKRLLRIPSHRLAIETGRWHKLRYYKSV